ncbi:hypothetical protein EHP00_2619 [Ecytonucleospora hepatopenaei]|nr:hypothetical protein EHP00_2619 [Ecytonucleospora hepatopenaei]
MSDIFIKMLIGILLYNMAVGNKVEYMGVCKIYGIVYDMCVIVKDLEDIRRRIYKKEVNMYNMC